jgi:hypothetical protein
MSFSRKHDQWAIALSVLILVGTAVFFCFSRLGFGPVPWPDGSAFYLPALELISWPPSWRMHAQAAFVPSYDEANFNLMPALPIVLGVLSKLGLLKIIAAPLLIKIISVVALLIWAGVFWRWLFQALVQQSIPPFRALRDSAILGLAALWDPTIRWGTLVVRTETWVGLCWMIILTVLWKNRKTDLLPSKALWKISGLLALSAYFHFEAIILVPAVGLAIMPQSFSKKGFFKAWWDSLLQIGLRTALFLSPWILYVLTHFSLFLKQMEVQFFRLSGSNVWISSPHLFFHSLFLEHGSPQGVPKIFNVAKAIFWVLILVLSISLGHKIYKTIQQPKKTESLFSRLTLAAAAAFWVSFYLWCTKAEVWFITLCHLMFWPWLGLTLLEYYGKKPNIFATTLKNSGIVYGYLAILGTLVQAQKIQPQYNWSEYQDWVSCIDRDIQKAIHHSVPKIWQPYVPDVLVELSSRHPDYDLTRALDFHILSQNAWDFMKKADVLLLTTFFDIPHGQTPQRYDGPPREEDITTQQKIPFGRESLNRLPLEQPGAWTTHVCHYGPFWASILSKNADHVFKD